MKLFTTTPPPRKRSDDNKHPNSISFPLDDGADSRWHPGPFPVDRYSQSEQKKPSYPHTIDDFEGSDDAGIILLHQSTGKAAAKSTRRRMFYFSTTFLLFAAIIGSIPNFAALWSRQFDVYFWDTTSTSVGLNDRHRVLFRSHRDDKTMPSYRSSASGIHTSNQKRPKLVIHIGPHKTASTTLQTDLTLYRDRLLLDNYQYLGRLYHPFTRNGEFFLNRSPDSMLQNYFRDMFAKCWYGRYVAANKILCVTDLRDALWEVYGTPSGANLPNLLISDEAFLKLFDDGDTNTTILNDNYVLLAQVLSRDWDIVLAVAYRRFFEWLPSAKYQKDKPTAERRSTDWLNASAVIDRKTRKFSQAGGGIPLQPLFPLPARGGDTVDLASETSEIIADWRREHFLSERTLATIRKITSSTTFSNTSATPLQLRIYHLYGKLSIRTHFFCHVLPGADHTCRASRRDDALLQTETRINTRVTDESSIVVTSYPSAYFDALAVAAAAPSIGLVNTKTWKRQQVASMLHDHYIAASVDWKEEMDQQTVASQIASEEVVVDDNEGVPYDDDAAGTSVSYSTSQDEKLNLTFKNPWELPLLCPSNEQLEQLLHESLSIEARHLPKLYRKAIHEHRAAFHKAVAESPADYCWIDTDSLLLQDTVWKEYISQTFSATQRLSAV